MRKSFFSCNGNILFQQKDRIFWNYKDSIFKQTVFFISKVREFFVIRPYIFTFGTLHFQSRPYILRMGHTVWPSLRVKNGRRSKCPEAKEPLNKRTLTLGVNERFFLHSFRKISCKTELFLNNISLLSFSDLNFIILSLNRKHYRSIIRK